MSEEEFKEMQQGIRELNELMRGKGADGGFIHAMLRLAEIIHGSKENPGGLILRMDKQDEKIQNLLNIVKMGSGAAFVISVAWMIFTHFHK